MRSAAAWSPASRPGRCRRDRDDGLIRIPSDPSDSGTMLTSVFKPLVKGISASAPTAAAKRFKLSDVISGSRRSIAAMARSASAWDWPRIAVSSAIATIPQPRLLCCV